MTSSTTPASGGAGGGGVRDSRPLTLVAIGLAFVIADLNGDFGSGPLDFLPDPLGWVMVGFGLKPLRERHRTMTVAFWSAVVLVPFSVVSYAATGTVVEVLDLLLASAFLVSLMLGVRTLSPLPSTRRIAAVVIAGDLTLTVAGLLAQLLLGDASTDVQLDGPFALVLVLLVVAAVALFVAFLVWLHRTGDQEPFRA